MYSLEDYIKQTIMFTNSLVIKSTCSGLAINKGLLLKGLESAKSTEPYKWKYYMNLAGIKHKTNNDVQCYVIETASYQSLSKELLDKYPYTKKELLANGSYYDDLINNYPNDMLFIHGCLYPVDMDKAIAAKDGEILAYNSNYVEDNETSLIKELNVFTTGFFRRWFVKGYTLVDELYMATVLANLYTAIPSKIINIRLSKILTPEVHSFHMEHFFRSNLDLWDDVQVLPKSSLMWMYKNLTHLKKNIGKNSTFEKVIEKLYTENGIGLGTYLIRTPDIEVEDNARSSSSIKSSSYKFKENVIATSKLNQYYEADNEKSNAIESILNSEIELLKTDKLSTTISDRDKYVVSNAIAEINKTRRDKQDTKIIEITSSKLFKDYGGDLHRMLLEHLIYFIKHDKIEYNTEYIDPNTNKVYNLNPRQVLLVALKYLLELAGTPDLKIKTLHYTTILHSDADMIDEVVKRLHDDGLTKIIAAKIKAAYPDVSTKINNVDECYNFILSMVNFYSVVWLLDANSSSTLVSSNIKHILNYITVNDVYSITDIDGGAKVDDLLGLESIIIEYTENYNTVDALTTLFSSIAGIDVDSTGDLSSFIDSYVNILQKLISYTTQVIRNKVEEEKLYLYYNNLDIYRTHVGIIQATDGKITPYDKSHIPIKGYANAFVDGISAEIIDTDAPEIAVGEWPISGWMILINSTYDMNNPLLGIEIYDLPVVDVSELQYKNDFIKDGKGSITPYDKSSARIGGSHNLFRDTPVDVFAGENTDTTLDNTYEDYVDKEVSGYGWFLPTVGESDATLIIELLDC